MIIRINIVALVLLPALVWAADFEHAQHAPRQVGDRIEAEAAEPVPLERYNESVAEKADHYCQDRTCDTPPTLLIATAPIYPSAALRAEEEGRASLVFDIDPTGFPINIVVESATAPEFGTAAVEAVKAWRFKPAVLGGQPIKYQQLRQAFPFELRD